MSRVLVLSPAEVDEVWSRWRSGQALRVMAREMRVSHSAVRGLIDRCGGIRPSPRRRWDVRLSLDEREEISRGLAAGDSLRSIAAALGRSPSTVCREVAANGGAKPVEHATTPCSILCSSADSRRSSRPAHRCASW